MKKLILALFAGLFLSGISFAQDAGKITEILNSEKVTYGQAAYLVAVYTGTVSDNASEETAVKKLTEAGLLAKANAKDSIPLSEYSLLCAKATNLKGGLFYSLFENSRYAVKELKAKGILPMDADPDYSVDGHEALSLLSNCIDLTTGGAE